MISRTCTLLSLVAALLVGCAADPALQPQLSSDLSNPSQAKGAFYVQLLEDERADVEMGRTYFGTIRGGFGNPIERMHFASPASEVVQTTAITVLRSLGYRADRFPAASEARDPTTKVITGRIYELYAKNNPWVGKRSVHAHMDICIPSGKWCKSIGGSDEDAKIPGPSGNSPIMGLWVRRLLEDKLTALFSSAEFAEALKDTGGTAQSPEGR